MGSLLAIVVPLALGGAVSPTIIAAQLVSLTASARPVARSWALAAGCAIVLLAVCGLALVLAAGTGGSGSPSRAGAIVKLVAAALLVALGVHSLRRRGTAPKPKPAKQHDGRVRLSRSFALGCGLMATNFSSILLVFPAVHEIGTNDASDAARVVAFVLLVTIALLPAYAPPLVVTLMGERARGPLDAMNRFFTAHRPAIAATLCFAFAALLAAAGLRAVT